jgi:hypothetical protein
MPHLYCVTHGKEHQDRVIGQWSIYRDEGESVLIVAGRLTSGPWACDRCNATLRPGRTAYLLTAFPRCITEGMISYDFAYERLYFAMEGEERLAVYGAAWPCGDIAALVPEAG